MSWTWWRSAWSGPWSRRVGLARSAATLLLLLLAGGAGTTLSAQSAGAAPGPKSGYLGTGEDKVYYEAAGAGPAIERLHEIKVPTLILVGEFDIPDVHAQAGALNVGTANSTRLVIRDAAHLLPLEQPELFN